MDTLQAIKNLDRVQEVDCSIIFRAQSDLAFRPLGSPTYEDPGREVI